MARQIGSNAPPLTDVTQQNYQIVSTNTLRNFQSASDALAAQAEMNNADYKQRVTEWQNREQQRQMDAQSSGGGGVAQGIGELGKQLVAGYAVVEELKGRRAAQKAAMEQQALETQMKLNAERRAEENLALDKAKFEYSMTSDQADREIRVDEIGYKRQQEAEADNLESVLTQSETILNQIETAAKDEMASLGKSAGVAKFKETVTQEIFNADWYKALPEGSVEKVKIDNLISKRMLATVGENADAMFEERKKLVQANTDLLTQSWLANNSGKLNQIKNGAGTMTVEQVNASIAEMDANFEALFENEDIKAMLKLDPSIAVRARIEQMKQYGVALDTYFGDSTKRSSEAQRYIDAANAIAMLEIQEQKTGKDMTADKEATLRSLGISTNYKDFPSSLPNRLDAQNRQLEAQVKYRTLIQQDAVAKRVVGEQTPAGQKYNRYIVGQYIYDNMDNIDMAIETLKKQQGVGLDDEYVSTQIRLLERFPQDRDKYAGLVKKNIELNQKIVSMSQPRQQVIAPGSPMGTFGGLSPEPTIMELPGASQEEIEAYKLEIKHNEEEMRRLATEWNAYGINIAKPSDRKMLDALKQETAATAAEVDKLAGEKGIQAPAPNPSPQPSEGSTNQTSTAPSPEEIKKVRNYVKYEFDANNRRKYDSIFNKHFRGTSTTATLASPGRRASTSRAETYSENLRKLPDKKNWTAQSTKPVSKIIISVGHEDWKESKGAPGEQALNEAVAQRILELAPGYGLGGKIELYRPPREYSNAELSTGKSDAMGDVGAYAEEQGAYAFEIHHNVRDKDAPANPEASNVSGKLSGVIPGLGGDGIHELDEELARVYGKFAADHRGGLRSPKRGITILELGGTVDVSDEYVDKAARQVLGTLSKAKFGTVERSYEEEGQVMGLNQQFKTTGNLIVEKVLAGDEKGAQALIDTQIKNMGTGFGEDMNKAMRSALTDVLNEAKNKRNFYRNKRGEQSRSNSPPSFSSGNQGKYQEVKSAVVTLNNEGDLTPAVHLNGRLATWKHGYAPFKGGTVTMTSDFRSSHRPNHHGIDLSSNDTRVASIQGGKVKWTGWYHDYGNTVFVETPDGKVEMYAHLSSMTVKKGQPIAPGDQVGVMGNTGRSTGAHLHFEVWGHSNWTHPDQSSRQVISPWDYLKNFKGKTTLPNPVGGTTQTPSAEWGMRNRKVAYHTGAVKIGNNLSYFRGWVFNENTGHMVKATPQQVEAAKTGVPEVVYRNIQERYRITNGTGQVVAGDYEIPYRAQQEGTFMFLVPAGYKNKEGQDVWELQGYYQNKRVFSKPVLGVPLQDGDFKVTQTYNYSSFANPAHKQQITDFVKKHGKGKGVTMYVRSVPKESLLVASPDSSYKDGALDLRGDLSINKADYANYGSPDQDFGYSALRNDPKLRQRLYETSKKLGVPMVWLADQIQRESSWSVTAQLTIYRGYIQIGNPHLYGITESELNDKYKYFDAIVKYHSAIMKEVGGYKDFEEFLMGVWGGGNGVRQLRKNKTNRAWAQSFDDGHVNWDGYRKAFEKLTGRRYRWAGMSPRSHHYHDIPSDTCPVCDSMVRSGSFQSHYY